MTGKLFGVGVGPGDPDLLTVKAGKILAAVPVIAYLAPEEGDSLARSIAAPHIPEGLTEIVLRTPFVPGRHPAEVYEKGAAEIAGHLDAGRDVAVLCEGDPFLYGSFISLFERLSDRFETEVVPGVSSVMAAPAEAGLPLVTYDESLAVVPATLPEDALAARIGAADAAVVLKVGRHMAKLRRVLIRLGRADTALYAERVGMPKDGRVLPLSQAPDKPPYFSLVLTKRGEPDLEGLPEGAALVALDPRGLALARRLAESLPGAEVHGRAGRAEGADVTFSETTAHLCSLFETGRPIVAVCAAGIVVRALAPLLVDKRSEPPVVAVSGDGMSVVPLLGGHRGANRLARAVAALTGGQAAVTTASEVGPGVALDDPPAGWTLANPGAAKDLAAALVADDAVGLRVEAGDAGWLKETGVAFADEALASVIVTDRRREDPGPDLVLHPPVLALGVGCERDTAPDELRALVRDTLAKAELAEAAIACVASVDVKADEPAVHALALELGVPARFFPPEELEAEASRLANPSDVVFREVGCHGVAEGAALAVAGGDSELVVTKTKSKRATCAVARAKTDIDPATVGRARGSLWVVGVGPGTPEWRTPAATKAISQATDVVGYKLYLDLISDLTAGKTLHDSALAQEEARCRMALDLAAEGRDVALVCSGDAGIYALATLVMELLDREDRADWNRLEIRTAPGVSAFQAAAARIGAPMGHDFCLVSLSDLLTPWEEIEKRLRAAAEGDFVVAFYNPVSKRRRTQLAAAQKILTSHRPADTPVILARSLGRPEEKVEVITLSELTPDHADMLTLVVVGNTQTKRMERGGVTRVYTPRGYAAKMDTNRS